MNINEFSHMLRESVDDFQSYCPSSDDLDVTEWTEEFAIFLEETGRCPTCDNVKEIIEDTLSSVPCPDCCREEYF